MRTSPAMNRGLEAYGLSRWNGPLSMSGLSQRPNSVAIVALKRQNRRNLAFQAIADGEKTPADEGQHHNNGRGYRHARANRSFGMTNKPISKSIDQIEEGVEVRGRAERLWQAVDQIEGP